jgi:acyl-CoA thioester hydrolase
MATPHHYRDRVAFADTDVAGIVHFTAILRYCERAEHAALLAAGVTVIDPDRGWPRVACGADFHAPLFFNDAFTVAAGLERIGRSSLGWRFRIRNAAETPIATCTMTTVLVQRSATPPASMAIPDAWREALVGLTLAAGE